MEKKSEEEREMKIKLRVESLGLGEFKRRRKFIKYI